MKQFSNNIVFVDTEFSDLNPYVGEILSIALVKMDGSELYLELEYDGACSAWVKEHILPTLTEKKVTRDVAKAKIRDFLGNASPYLLGFVNQYDDVYLSKLFVDDEKPYNWLPLDLASMLFMRGLDPQAEISPKLGLDSSKYREHHALDDARWIRDAYCALVDTCVE